MMKVRALALIVALLAVTLAPAWAEPPPIGQKVEAFAAADEAGTQRSLADQQGKTVVLVVWGAQCPTSQGYAQRLNQLAQHARAKGAIFWGVAPNKTDDAGAVSAAKGAQGLGFPIIIDKGGAIARSLGARMTPTAAVIDGQGVLRYLGAIDDDPGGNRGNATTYLKGAIDAVTGGGAPSPAETKVVGSLISAS
jgi:peroxiredoxin